MTVNGRVVPLADAGAHATALDWLRGIGLTGAKEGCAEGECGACAVLVATAAPDGGAVWTPVNACLVPVHALDGQEVVTAEGLGSPDDLHPVQEGLASAGGSQCGFCTPGFVCSMAAEYYRPGRAHQATTAAQDAIDRAEAVPDGHGPDGHGEPGPGAEHGPNGFDLHALSGNLCRCTGYRPIRDAAYALGAPPPGDPLRERMSSPAPAPVATDVEAADGRFVRPATLDDALRLLRDSPDAVPVAGATDWGVEVNLRGARAPTTVAIDRLSEMRTLTIGEDVIEIGAAVPLSEIEQRLSVRVPLLGQLIPQFASRLIRNRATLGGNLGTASPIGDAAPALLALGARVVLVSADGGEREVDLADYFTGYRTTVRRRDELIRAVRIPLAQPGSTAFHKVAKRRFDDISSVAVACALDIDDGLVATARIGLGGVAATPLRAYATERVLVGRRWSTETVAEASAVLEREGTPLSDHRASAEYRSLMLGAALRALFADTAARGVPV